MVKKSREYENENKALGPTLDPIVSPLLMAHSALILVFETSIYTITPVIEKNYYVKSGISMCLDTYMRLYIMFMFVFTFLDTNTQKLKTVGIYLADVLYKTKQDEIDDYIKEDIQEEVKKEINAKGQINPLTDSDNQQEELNREYNG